MRKALTDTGFRYFYVDRTGDAIVSNAFTSLREAAQWEVERRMEEEGRIKIKKVTGSVSDAVEGVIELTENAPEDYKLTREEINFAVSSTVRLEAGESLEPEAAYRLGKVLEFIELLFAFSQQEDLYDLKAIRSMIRSSGVKVENPDDVESEIDHLMNVAYSSEFVRLKMKVDGNYTPELDHIMTTPPSTPEERSLAGSLIRGKLSFAKNHAPEAWKDVFSEMNLNLALS